MISSFILRLAILEKSQVVYQTVLLTESTLVMILYQITYTRSHPNTLYFLKIENRDKPHTPINY